MDNKELALEFFNDIFKNKNNSIKFKHIDDDFGDGEAMMLAYLTFIENEVNPCKLCNNLNVSSARIAKILNSLENKGYIIRKNDAIDKRKCIIILSDDAKEKMLNLKNKALERIEFIINKMGIEEFNEFRRLAKKINELNQEFIEKEGIR